MHTQHYIDFLQFVEFTTSGGLFAYLLYAGVQKINKRFFLTGVWWSLLYFGIWLSAFMATEFTVLSKQTPVFLAAFFAISLPFTISSSMILAYFMRVGKQR